MNEVRHLIVAADNISIKPLGKSRCSNAAGRVCDRGISWLIDRIHTLAMLLTTKGWRDVGSSDVVKILQLKCLYTHKFNGSTMN